MEFSLGKPIQVLVVSRFPLSGGALTSRLAGQPSRYRTQFRECLSRKPFPAGFRPQVVLVNCADCCVFGSPPSSTLYPFAKVLAISRAPTIAQQVVVLRFGIHGVFDEAKDGFEELERAIAAVLAGEVWVERKAWAEFFLSCREHPDAFGDGLSPRERELIALLRLGCSNASIARRLHLSSKTVKWHLTAIYRRWGVRNRAQAALRYQELHQRAKSELGIVTG